MKTHVIVILICGMIIAFFTYSGIKNPEIKRIAEMVLEEETHLKMLEENNDVEK